MKKQYKYLGALCVIHDVAKLNHLGQSIALEDEVARIVVERGHILPADVYDSIGFTAEEEKLYPQPGDVVRAPASFIEKRNHALTAWIDFRAKFLAEVTHA